MFKLGYFFLFMSTRQEWEGGEEHQVPPKFTAEFPVEVGYVSNLKIVRLFLFYKYSCTSQSGTIKTKVLKFSNPNSEQAHVYSVFTIDNVTQVSRLQDAEVSPSLQASNPQCLSPEGHVGSHSRPLIKHRSSKVYYY